MAVDLSVGGVTNATYVASGTNTTQNTTMNDLSQRKTDYFIQKEKELIKQFMTDDEQKYREAAKKYNELQILKEILKQTGLSREMLIMELKKNGYIKSNIKNPTDEDIIEGYNRYIKEPKWA